MLVTAYGFFLPVLSTRLVEGCLIFWDNRTHQVNRLNFLGNNEFVAIGAGRWETDRWRLCYPYATQTDWGSELPVFPIPFLGNKFLQQDLVGVDEFVFAWVTDPASLTQPLR